MPRFLEHAPASREAIDLQATWIFKARVPSLRNQDPVLDCDGEPVGLLKTKTIRELPPNRHGQNVQFGWFVLFQRSC
jgi:hypothetical protein